MTELERFIEAAQRLLAEAAVSRQSSDSALTPHSSRTFSFSSTVTPIKSQPSFQDDVPEGDSSSKRTPVTPLSKGYPLLRESQVHSLSRDQPTDSEVLRHLSPKMIEIATLHGALLRDLRPGLWRDLELLFKLLSLDDSSSSIKPASHQSSDDELNFNNCAPYAVAVLTRCEGLLRSLGPQIATLLSGLPAIRRWAPTLVQSLSQKVSDERFTPSRNEFGSAAFGQGAFREETDSRHNFKEKEQQSIYKNRESVRDEFLTLMHRTVSSRTAYLPDTDKALRESFQNCYAKVLKENLSWFSRFFVQQLISISLDDREFDEEVRMWVANRKGESKVDLLARRFDAAGSASAASASFNNPSKPSPTTYNEPIKDLSGSKPTWWEDLFPRPAERFFPLFLYIVDSYALTSNVILSVKAHLNRLSLILPIPEQTNVLVDRIASCNILAKFLGFISYYPRFDSSRTAFIHRSGSQAFEHLYQEGIEESNLSGMMGLDVRQTLIKSVETNSILLVVPWIIRFIKAGSYNDMSSRSSEYLRETIIMLNMVRAGIRNSSVVKALILKHGKGFGLIRLLADIDSLTQLLPSERESDFKLEERLERLGFQESVEDSLERSSDRALVAHDGVPLDRAPTSCFALERLRLILQSLASLQSGMGGKLKLRRINQLFSDVRNVPSDSVPASVSGAKGISETVNSSFRVVTNRIVLQTITDVCLHRQPDIARTVEFSIQSAPSVIIHDTETLLKSLNLEEMKRIKSLDDLTEWESIAAEGVVIRAFVKVKKYVENLVDLTLSNRSREVRATVVGMVLEKTEPHVDKLLKRRVNDLLASHRTNLVQKSSLPTGSREPRNSAKPNVSKHGNHKRL